LVKVSYVAREPGIYKVTWSNVHSWFKAKTLMYRILVLKPEVKAEGEPVFPAPVRKEDPLKQLFDFDLEELSTVRKQSMQRLIDMGSVVKHASNVDSIRRREITQFLKDPAEKWSSVSLFIDVDPVNGRMLISHKLQAEG